MKFNYQITEPDYKAGQLLYWRLIGAQSQLRRAMPWFLFGIFLIIVAWNEWGLNWTPIITGGVGIWFVIAAIKSLFLGAYFRKQYQQSGLAGEQYNADVDDAELRVASESCTWKIAWPSVKVAGENHALFIVYAANTLFMFGKQYMESDQQDCLRSLLSEKTDNFVRH